MTQHQQRVRLGNTARIPVVGERKTEFVFLKNAAGEDVACEVVCIGLMTPAFGNALANFVKQNVKAALAEAFATSLGLTFAAPQQPKADEKKPVEGTAEPTSEPETGKDEDPEKPAPPEKPEAQP